MSDLLDLPDAPAEDAGFDAPAFDRSVATLRQRAAAGAYQASCEALEQLLQRERAGRLAEAVAELPFPFREVLTLRFEEEMQLEEIAQVLALPLGTVKTRLHRSLKHLRRTLEMQLGVAH